MYMPVFTASLCVKKVFFIEIISIIYKKYLGYSKQNCPLQVVQV